MGRSSLSRTASPSGSSSNLVGSPTTDPLKSSATRQHSAPVVSGGDGWSSSDEATTIDNFDLFKCDDDLWPGFDVADDATAHADLITVTDTYDACSFQYDPLLQHLDSMLSAESEGSHVITTDSALQFELDFEANPVC